LRRFGGDSVHAVQVRARRFGGDSVMTRGSAAITGQDGGP